MMKFYSTTIILLLLVWCTTGLEKGICLGNLYQCEHDTSCIKIEEHCNGIEDCPNGSDELNCEDEALDVFINNNFKKRPSAVNDDKPSACNLTYTGLCFCRGNEILCGHKNLEKIPNDLPSNQKISLLDFEANHFPNLSFQFLKGIPEDVGKLKLFTLVLLQGVLFLL